MNIQSERTQIVHHFPYAVAIQVAVQSAHGSYFRHLDQHNVV